ncbi:MAG: hypothetical protein HYZ23_05705 [Chloroflexi bacterium]|nr:hypothetical protein [Chloroflexota bacterium]
MKKIFIAATICLLLAACGAPAQPGSVETIVASTLSALTAAVPPATVTPSTQNSGITISANSIQFVIPAGLGDSANVESVAELLVTDGPVAVSAPAHSKFTLTGYPLQGKFFEAYILVYPAPEYESINEAASRNIQALRNILINPSAPLTRDALPGITELNAGMVFASNMQTIPFQNGNGVRFLTQYAQYTAPANNNDLFYQFQGLTGDGKYYILAILPVNAPFLAADSNIPQTSLPADGIPFNGESPDKAYYEAIVNRLGQTAPDVFTPSLGSLDALIQSIVIK